MDTDIDALEKIIAKYGGQGVEELTKAKRKAMANTEKKYRAKIKKELQAEGIIPPDKPRLNRKKFVEEAKEVWNTRALGFFSWDQYVEQAITWMLTLRTSDRRISPETVGVAKLLKITVRLQEFNEKLKKEGRTECTIKEQYEYIRDIIEA